MPGATAMSLRLMMFAAVLLPAFGNAAAAPGGPPAWAWSASVFLDYKISLDAASGLRTGILFRRSASDWEGQAALFHGDPEDGPNDRGYAGRIRYRLARNHKVGVEYFGFDSPYLMLGYYGDVSSVLSVQFAAGANVGTPGDRAARVEFVWHVD